MATYVVSDIHGQLDKFIELLNLVNFKYDGLDELHILGDMIDWGEKSLETLLYCKALADKYDFIHVYMGNHEKMMLDSITDEHFNDFINEGMPKYLKNIMSLGSILTGNWYINNGGDKTYKTFHRLAVSKQEEIIKFLKKLLYYNDKIVVDGQKFYLAHAAPYTDQPNEVPINYKRSKPYVDGYDFTVWHRFIEQDETFTDKKYKNHILIHGHTPTKVKNEEGKFIIKRTRDRICIDTGAKMMYKHESHPECRMSCLRLDDLKEFYVSY